MAKKNKLPQKITAGAVVAVDRRVFEESSYEERQEFLKKVAAAQARLVWE